MADQSGTIPITCARDGHAHDVTDESLIDGQRTGRYQARCGYLVCAAALTAPIGRPCPECAAISLTVTTRPDRRSRHRRPGWLGQLLAAARSSGLTGQPAHLPVRSPGAHLHPQLRRPPTAGDGNETADHR